VPAPTITDWLSAVGSILGAVGTISAVVYALFQDQIRARLFPARASITLRDPRGELTDLMAFNHREPTHFFHLRVKNETGRALHRCSVQLVEVSSRTADGNWREDRLPVPLPLQWGLAEIRPAEIDIAGHEEVIADFGRFRHNSGFGTVYFEPALMVVPLNFRGILKGAGSMRFHVALRADELAQPCYATIEVTSTGKWSKTHEELPSVLQVRRVNAPKSLSPEKREPRR
jgi:hypothetical protein